MANITLAQAQAIVSAAPVYAREKNLVNPMAVIVLDVRAVPKAYAVEDGSAPRRWDFAHGKAYGALAMSVRRRPTISESSVRSLILSWHGLSGPPIPAHAAKGGPDKPNHDEGEMAHI